MIVNGTKKKKTPIYRFDIIKIYYLRQNMQKGEKE